MNDSFEQEFYDVVSNPDVFTDEKFHNQLEKKTPNKIQDQVHEQLNQSCIEISSWCGEIIKKDVSPDLLSSLRDGTVAIIVRALSVGFVSGSKCSVLTTPDSFVHPIASSTPSIRLSCRGVHGLQFKSCYV